MGPARIGLMIAALAAGAASPAAAATLTGRVTGGTIPAAAAADVRAVDLRTLRIVGADDVSPTRRWSIPGLGAGTYSILTTVVRARGGVTQAVSAPVRARRAGRLTVTTSLARRRAPRPRPRVRRADAHTSHASAASPVVVIRSFAGSGPNAALGRGLAIMLITDLGADNLIPATARFTLHFLPEPTTLVLLGSGIVVLAARGLVQRRC